MTVVVGAHHLRIRRTLRGEGAGLTIVPNPQWQQGLAGSIRVGVSNLSGEASGVLILLSDQPRVSVQDIQKLARRWRAQPSRIFAARYAGIAGAPAIFPRRHWRRLKQLKGDQGAGKLLRQLPINTVEISAAAFDVDTLDDLRQRVPRR